MSRSTKGKFKNREGGGGGGGVLRRPLSGSTEGIIRNREVGGGGGLRIGSHGRHLGDVKLQSTHRGGGVDRKTYVREYRGYIKKS